MKFILAIISLLYINTGFSQETVRYYKLEELPNAPIDSVFAIDLKKMSLTEIPEIIFQFKNLQYLNLSKNKLTTAKGLEVFKQLKWLSLDKNKLTYFPIGICQLTNLEDLKISRNDIEVIPICIEYCQKLKNVELWSTMITGLPEEMTRISTIRMIDFTGIQINVKRQEQLRNMFPKAKLILDPPCNCTH